MFGLMTIKQHEKEIDRLQETYSNLLAEQAALIRKSYQREDVLRAALGEYATSEVQGTLSNSRIIEYHSCTSGQFKSDEISWCSAFMNWCCTQAGIEGTNDATAKSWLKWGRKTTLPQVGDIVVFNSKAGPKDWHGHVALFVREQDGYIYVLGGNQSNTVKISAYNKKQLNCYRTFC